MRDPLPTAALTVLVLAALVIPGSSAWSGPVLLALTPTHGVHLTDLTVVAVGLVVLLEAGRRWRDGGLLTPTRPLPAVRDAVLRAW